VFRVYPAQSWAVVVPHGGCQTVGVWGRGGGWSVPRGTPVGVSRNERPGRPERRRGAGAGRPYSGGGARSARSTSSHQRAARASLLLPIAEPSCPGWSRSRLGTATASLLVRDNLETQLGSCPAVQCEGPGGPATQGTASQPDARLNRGQSRLVSRLRDKKPDTAAAVGACSAGTLRAGGRRWHNRSMPDP
jgi:hypothetical protein